jgi:glycosyltransferase involved in cell wall biosynthesis
MGEVVLAKNFSEILYHIYDEIQVYSTIDTLRDNGSEFKQSGFKVNYFGSKKDLAISLLDYLRSNSKCDVHFLNAPLTSYLHVLHATGRAFLYQFAYNVLNEPSTIMRSVGALPLTYLEKLRIITTSFSYYTRFSKLFRRHYYYEPAPIQLNYPGSLVKRNDEHQLKVLYLGHGSYHRFPYDKTLRSLAKLSREGYNINFQVCISKLGYTNYQDFVVDFQRYLEQSGAETFVEVSLRNLTESEKYAAISSCDVLLYPALINAAIDPPLVILEAMALGKCVIASSVQSVPYILGGDRGIIVDPQRFESDLYMVLKLLAKNPELSGLFGQNAKRWFLQEHSMLRVFNNFRSLIGD